MTTTTTTDARIQNRVRGFAKFYVSMHVDTLAHTPAGLRRPHSAKAWVAMTEAERRAHLIAHFTIEDAAIGAARTARAKARGEAEEPSISRVAPAPEPETVQPIVAYVACAGSCGAWVPSRSTYRPAVRYCSPRRGRAACPVPPQSA